ncbi:MAG: hypothetical protein M3P48_10720 [Actinomycetota bacterium]|nr:hypothetical protein [Actinomycetota bacterium]
MRDAALQSYAISRPLPEDRVPAWLDTWPATTPRCSVVGRVGPPVAMTPDDEAPLFS